jgi:enterochelin esterase-like enzyme
MIKMAYDYTAPEGFDRVREGAAYGELTEVEYNSKTTGTLRKCFVYTPPGYNKETVYPVMYLLHGIGGTHTEWLNGAPNEIISNLIGRGETPPFITVIPNIRAAKDDSVPAEDAMFTQVHFNACDNFINDLRDDLMPFIQSAYPVSGAREKTAIAGLSMGGREALFIGLKMPGTFGYIGAFSPAPGLLPAPPDDNRPGHPGHKGMLTAEEMTLPDGYRDNTFILMCSGTQEEMFNYISDSYREAFDSNGVKYNYYITEGGHDFRVWRNGLYNFAKRIFR